MILPTKQIVQCTGIQIDRFNSCVVDHKWVQISHRVMFNHVHSVAYLSKHFSMAGPSGRFHLCHRTRICRITSYMQCYRYSFAISKLAFLDSASVIRWTPVQAHQFFAAFLAWRSQSSEWVLSTKWPFFQARLQIPIYKIFQSLFCQRVACIPCSSTNLASQQIVYTQDYIVILDYRAANTMRTFSSVDSGNVLPPILRHEDLPLSGTAPLFQELQASSIILNWSRK